MSADHYAYGSAEKVWTDDYLAPHVIEELHSLGRGAWVLDAGCGNGNLTARLAADGFCMAGFDASPSGIELARAAHPQIRFEVASAYEDLSARFGMQFDACVCVEVIEHLFDPRAFVRHIFGVLRRGGLLVLTTPYHGYVKNLALALSGRTDAHYTALWAGGHIKFWSRKTLTQLLCETGFQVVRVQGAGRVPLLWKSMVVTARKP